MLYILGLGQHCISGTNFCISKDVIGCDGLISLPHQRFTSCIHVLASVGQEGASAHLGWAVGVLLMTDTSVIIVPWRESAVRPLTGIYMPLPRRETLHFCPHYFGQSMTTWNFKGGQKVHPEGTQKKEIGNILESPWPPHLLSTFFGFHSFPHFWSGIFNSPVFSSLSYYGAWQQQGALRSAESH